MPVVANLLAQKQKLLERVQEDPGPNERAELERLLAQIDNALNLLELPASAEAGDDS
jgi:hypothetical protein